VKTEHGNGLLVIKDHPVCSGGFYSLFIVGGITAVGRPNLNRIGKSLKLHISAAKLQNSCLVKRFD
jgi:hypothetical protein